MQCVAETEAGAGAYDEFEQVLQRLASQEGGGAGDERCVGENGGDATGGAQKGEGASAFRIPAVGDRVQWLHVIMTLVDDHTREGALANQGERGEGGENGEFEGGREGRVSSAWQYSVPGVVAHVHALVRALHFRHDSSHTAFLEDGDGRRVSAQDIHEPVVGVSAPQRGVEQGAEVVRGWMNRQAADVAAVLTRLHALVARSGASDAVRWEVSWIFHVLFSILEEACDRARR